MMPSNPLVLASAYADGAALTASITATSILHASGKAVVPASSLQLGSFIKAYIRGRISTVVTTPGTLTLDMRFGNVVVSALGAIPLNIVAQANASFEAEITARITALGTGTAATALVMGRFTSRALVGSALVAAGGNGTIILPDTTPAVGTGFDSTAALLVDVFATWSLNNANSIQVHQSVLEFKV
jgi:hypothetical protein